MRTTTKKAKVRKVTKRDPIREWERDRPRRERQTTAKNRKLFKDLGWAGTLAVIQERNSAETLAGEPNYCDDEHENYVLGALMELTWDDSQRLLKKTGDLPTAIFALPGFTLAARCSDETYKGDDILWWYLHDLLQHLGIGRYQEPTPRGRYEDDLITELLEIYQRHRWHRRVQRQQGWNEHLKEEAQLRKKQVAACDRYFKQGPAKAVADEAHGTPTKGGRRTGSARPR